jgi:hypothetical protein
MLVNTKVNEALFNFGFGGGFNNAFFEELVGYHNFLNFLLPITFGIRLSLSCSLHSYKYHNRTISFCWPSKQCLCSTGQADNLSWTNSVKQVYA